MKPTNEDRRDVATRIRELRKHAWDESSVFDLLGCAVEEHGMDDTDQLFARLADLIDPTAHERTVADNLALIDRNRELERELARLKRELKMMDGHLD